jgi:ferric-dicitrate binding protein FerR (iron transport regulator)
MLDRYLRNEATEEEVKLLGEFFESYKYDHSDSTLLSNDLHSKGDILRKINERIAPESRSRTFPLWIKIAASISLLVACTYFFLGKSATLSAEQEVALFSAETTARGEKSEFLLPDGSKVFLNSGSRLSFPQKFAGTTREVALEGEAYFNVTHDPEKPFFVNTALARTKVLGTSFNVNAHKGKDVQITLIEGKVDVSCNGNIANLLPGEQALVGMRDHSVVKRSVDVLEYVSWRNNVVYFKETKLIDAVAVLENWYDVDIAIQSESLKNCRITATYKSESLDNVLKSIQFLLGAKIDKHTNQTSIVISGKGCK